MIFNNPPLYCYINLRSSIFFCLSSGDTYLSLGISFSSSLLTVSDLFCCKFFETFVILLAILLTIKPAVASAVFWIALFEAVLYASAADFWHGQEDSGYVHQSSFHLCFLPIFCSTFI